MEYRELLARLAEFFNTWNRRHVPAGQVNRLQIKLYDQTISYIFNGQTLCTIEIFDDQTLREALSTNPQLAEERLLLSILETTGELTTADDLRKIKNRQEREEVVVLLLRLYHALEADVIQVFPAAKALFNRKYFRKQDRPLADRLKLMAAVEQFRDDLTSYFHEWARTDSITDCVDTYLVSMSIAELFILFNAVTIITDVQDRWLNVAAGARVLQKLAH